MSNGKNSKYLIVIKEYVKDRIRELEIIDKTFHNAQPRIKLMYGVLDKINELIENEK